MAEWGGMTLTAPAQADPLELPYRAALIDWDGTLAQTLQAWMRCYLQACQEWGCPATPEQVAAQFGSWQGVLDLGVAQESFQAYWDRMDVLLAHHLPSVDLYPHAVATLQAVRNAGVSTALVTTGRRAVWGPSFTKHALEPLFDVVVSGDEVTQHKPHPEPLLLALQRLGIPDPGQAVMIGDSDKDLGAANAAGMDSVLFYPPDHQQFYNKPILLEQYQPRHQCASWRGIGTVLLP